MPSEITECIECANHYKDEGLCDKGRPLNSPHQKKEGEFAMRRTSEFEADPMDLSEWATIRSKRFGDAAELCCMLGPGFKKVWVVTDIEAGKDTIFCWDDFSPAYDKCLEIEQTWAKIDDMFDSLRDTLEARKEQENGRM